MFPGLRTLFSSQIMHFATRSKQLCSEYNDDTKVRGCRLLHRCCGMEAA